MSTLRSMLEHETEHMQYAYCFARANAILNARGCPIEDEFSPDIFRRKQKELHQLAGIPMKTGKSATHIDVTTLKGYHVYSSINRLIPMFKLEAVSFQAEFVERCLRAMLPLIYAEGGEWNLYQTAIREYHEVTTQKSILAIACGRQMGKTTIVGAILAAIAVCCSGLNTMVISLGERQSQTLKSGWMKNLNIATNIFGKGYIRSDNTETTLVSPSRGLVSGDTNQFKFLPSESRGGRGQQAHLIVVDEAAFVKQQVYAELLLPLMSVDGAVTILMSTPPRQAGFFTELLTKLDSVTGELIADVLRVELACEACRGKGLTSCPHSEFETPSWQANTTKKRQIQELYSGNANDRDRELSGVVVMDNVPAFNPVWVDSILNPRAIHRFASSPPDALVLGIDPCGGGQSHAGICVVGVCYEPSPCIVVVGGASIDMSKADNSLLYHGLGVLLHGLRKDSRFSRCPIAVCIEGNYSQISAVDVANAVSKLDRNIIIMSETRSNHTKSAVNGPYVLMNGINGKERYVAITTFFLRTFRFRFCDRLYADTEGPKAGEDFKQLLTTQMRSFLLETKKSPDNGVHTTIKKSYSGKTMGQDDACIAMMMAIHQACIFFSSRTYSQVRGARPRVLTIADDAVDRDYARIISESIHADANETVDGHIRRLPWDPNSEIARRGVR